ncbi:MAG: hypothetical protein QM783_19810 [Phycisphaerales bacterium]
MEPSATPIPSDTPADPHLVAYLADRDLPCPACTYNLRGLQASRCPECNRELELQIRLAEPRLGWWVVALSGAAAMFGFHAMFLLIFAVVAMKRRSSSLESSMFLMMVTCAAVGLAALWYLAVRRRAFCNLAMGARVSLAIAIWLVAALSAAVLPLLFR